MELKHAHQISFDELLNENIDIVIAACGYESRSSHLIQLSHFNAKKKIALLFNEENEEANHQKNQIIFKEKGFEIITVHASSSTEIISVLNSISSNSADKSIKLIIDYSSMSKIWFGSIIKYFAYNDLEYCDLTVYFCYTPEHFVTQKISTKGFVNPEPSSFNRPLKNANKPIALVVGLGYNGKKVEFLSDFFEPKVIYYFLPSPSFDENYTNLALTSNQNILSEIDTNQILQYPATDIEEIDSQLTSLCLSLRLKFRIILISLGPKTFSLATLLLNARYPDNEIWNMNASDQCIDLKPAGVPIVYKAVLTSEDDKYN